MDFLTRLAQRLTGDLPAVQPRLPLLFELTAGTARAGKENGETAFSNVRELENLPAPQRSTRPASTPPTPSARQMAPANLDPLHPPVNTPAPARLSPYPAAPRSAPAETSGNASSETPVHEIIQPPTSPRRGVAVAVRPMAPTGTPALSTASRRGAVTREMHGRSEPGHTAGTDERLPGPPTVHVHIGRVDVRAVLPPAAQPRPAAPPASPRATLEEYLSGRKGGSQP